MFKYVYYENIFNDLSNNINYTSQILIFSFLVKVGNNYLLLESDENDTLCEDDRFVDMMRTAQAKGNTDFFFVHAIVQEN